LRYKSARLFYPYENSVSIFDTAKLELIKKLTVGKSPSGLVISPDSRWLYVANRMDNTLSQIDLRTFKIRNTTQVGAHPFGISLDKKGERIYSANVESNDVTVLSAKNLKRITHIINNRPIFWQDFCLLSVL
jgi:YVTN family beta-propeller protein